MGKSATAKVLGVKRAKVDDAVASSSVVPRAVHCNDSKLSAERKERIRMRTLVSMVQAGGQYRQQALYRLRE
eukprot:255253-Karenia_brevis.AAC.1